MISSSASRFPNFCAAKTHKNAAEVFYPSAAWIL